MFLDAFFGSGTRANRRVIRYSGPRTWSGVRKCLERNKKEVDMANTCNMGLRQDIQSCAQRFFPFLFGADDARFPFQVHAGNVSSASQPGPPKRRLTERVVHHCTSLPSRTIQTSSTCLLQPSLRRRGTQLGEVSTDCYHNGVHSGPAPIETGVRDRQDKNWWIHK